MPFLISACEETGNRPPSDYEDLNGLYRGERTFNYSRMVTDSTGNDTTLTNSAVYFADSLRISNANENTVDVAYQRIVETHTLNRSTLSELSGNFTELQIDSIQELNYDLAINGDSLVGTLQMNYSADATGQYQLEFIKVE